MTHGSILVMEDHESNNTDLAICDPYSVHELYTDKDVIIHASLINIFGACGVWGNVVMLIILYHPKKKTCFNVLLRKLVLSDSLIIISIVFWEGIARVIYKFYKTIDVFYFNRFLYNFGMIPYFAQTLSTYLIVAMTIERFVAISKPFHARASYTVYKTRLLILGLLIFSILFNIPMLLFKPEITNCMNQMTNEIHYFLRRQKYNANFELYYISILYPTIMFIIPMIGLIISNICLYKAVKKSGLMSKSLTYQENRDRKMTAMLVTEVTVFLICNSVQPLAIVLKDVLDVEQKKYIWMANTFLCLLHSCLHLSIYIKYDDKFSTIFSKVFFLEKLKKCNSLDSVRSILSRV